MGTNRRTERAELYVLRSSPPLMSLVSVDCTCALDVVSDLVEGDGTGLYYFSVTDTLPTSTVGLRLELTVVLCGMVRLVCVT